MRYRVFLADDHAIVRDGLREILEAQGEFEVVGEGADGAAVLRGLARIDCDVLVLDLSLPRVDGSEVLRRVQALRPGLPVVVLSMYPESQFAARSIREGAFAYLNKSCPTARVLDTVRRAAMRMPPPEAAEELAAGEPHERLSPREFQVFLLLVGGRSVSEIAAELDVSVPTASTHLSHVRQKLGARTNAEVIQYAARAGLIG